MMVLNPTRGFFWVAYFFIVACSAQAPLLKVTAGESSLVLDSTAIEHVIAGEDAAGSSYVQLTLSAKGISNMANFTESNIGKDLEIFHGTKSVYGKVTLRDKLTMKEIFVSVPNKAEANKLTASIENSLRPRATPR